MKKRFTKKNMRFIEYYKYKSWSSVTVIGVNFMLQTRQQISFVSAFLP